VQDDVRASFADRTPIRRFVTPDEVAKGVELLVDSAAMTGQVLSIDGGLSIS
jgi:NAD(P)-dependent dehydrogenase (short-subunit alcohol dehydrogenase family)